MNEQILAVRRMQDYIEAHLSEEITPADLSGASLYSPWHSYRLFVQYLNMSPSEYIRRSRLAKCALRLRDEKLKIIDAALDCGFNSVDGFQRAFFKEFGCNPHSYSKNPVPIYLFTPYKIEQTKSDMEEKTMEKCKSVFIQKIVKPERKVIIKRGVKADNYFDYCGEVGCDVWGLLLSMKSISGEPVCLWLPEKYIKPNTSKYVQGVEVATDYSGEIPDGFDVITLPEASYLMFQGEPFAEEAYEQAIQQVLDSLEKFNFDYSGFAPDNENPRIQLEPRGERGYIELIPVK